MIVQNIATFIMVLLASGLLFLFGYMFGAERSRHWKFSAGYCPHCQKPFSMSSAAKMTRYPE